MDAQSDVQALRPPLTGDKALFSIDDDEFGLKETIGRLSKTLATMVRGDGYALGIEGSWGSGKSTFVNFIAEQLEKISGQHVLRFEPWLVGDKSMLIAAFFSLLATEIDKIEESSEFGSSFTSWQLRRARRKLSNSIRKYGKYIGALSGPVSGAASLDPSGTTALAAIGLKGFDRFIPFFGNAVPLEKLKAEIVEGLRELRRMHSEIRFTVVIDDVDRLPPEEAVEVLRMVQKVADFPCITYLICYDSKVLSEQVRHRLQIEDGRRYTEKILQEVIHIPPQEPFALRRALKRKLQKAFPNEFERIQGDRDAEYRLHLFFDVWGGTFLTTPRDVARLFDAVALNWPLLPLESDFCDFLWLQLLKLKSYELYTWTREYLQNVGAYRDGGRAGDTQPGEMAQSLLEQMKKHGWASRTYISGINRFLPGVGSFAFDDESKRRVFDFTRDELGAFEAKHRLGSPSHWRQYFAFEAPSYALKDGDLVSFRRACATNVGKAKAFLLELLKREHERRGHFVDLLLDRLLDQPEGSLSTSEADGMAWAFALTMDELAVEAVGIQEFGRSELWRKAVHLVEKNKPSDLSDLVTRGKAINWLSHLVRDLGFAHGLPKGNRSYPENQWLSREALDEAVVLVTRRYETFGVKRIFALPSPLDVLYCWVQLGNASIARQYIAAATRDDAGFLSALQAMRGWQNSSDTGVTHPLRDDVVGLFLDKAEIFSRLEMLAMSGRPRATRKRASALLKAWERSDGVSNRVAEIAIDDASPE
ncbi:KAP family P-loop NTPase fold protein [Bradyrhizobium sp. DOA9]|uniref:KAP family P-loop NTPase fold protein n=1 Tax=Bradyrhizobium sp. DOA9 TaxID=1126627 RepID=UPI00046A88D1|nr:P-loop NTPase fold protein [Bradyrhizobium sp. DOA9]